MSMLHSVRFHRFLLTLIFLCIGTWALSVHAQSVTWQILPWPDNQNWGGPRGNPAITNGNQITLTGQNVLSVQSFTGPLTISFDVLLPARSTQNGSFDFFFVLTNQATNLEPDPNIDLQMGFDNLSSDHLTVYRNIVPNANIWGPNPFTVSANTTYHYSISVAANGQVGWSINGQDVGLSNAVVVSYGTFKIYLSGWQPTAVWQVTNFTVTPQQTTLAISCTTAVTVNTDPGRCTASQVNLGLPATNGNCPGTPTLTNNAPTVFPIGTNDVIWTATDACGNSATCTQNVIVVDNQPPVMSDATVTPKVLWPPNHALVLVTVNYTTTGNCGVTECELSASSNDTGDGGTANDIQLIPGDAHHVYLRAKRSGSGSGRVYTITVTCTDTNGNVVQKTAEVIVPHDKRKN